MHLLFLSFITLHVLANATPSTATLKGTARDAGTGEPLAAANVRVLGTSRGTITNTSGEYSIVLATGEYRILFTMLGYAADTVSLRLDRDQQCDVRLFPSDIVLPEVVVTAEDPAIGIIRKAIANKQRWIDRLRSYEMQAFTRQTIYRDTAVAAINESYTKGYWQKGDTLREIVTQRRQTANVQPAFNFASVGRILNFVDERISFLGYTFVGPTALDALDYYDYKLLRTRSAAGNDLYEIKMIPRSRTVPLFEGTVNIAGGSYALVGIDVQPNVAFQIPFTKDVSIRYRQEFGLYESSYWMPADIRIKAALTVSVVGFSIPRIMLSQTSVISDYSINAAIPDSIFKKPRLVIDSGATRLDSSYWAANTVLPLDSLEQRAYRTLDSTQSLDVQFRPGGAMMTLGGGTGVAGAIFSYADVSFNRVEGFHLGAHAQLDSVTDNLSLSAGVAYGFSDRRGKYILGATVYPGAHRAVGIGAEVYRIADYVPDRGYFTSFTNSFTALLGKNDYRDYFEAEGGKIFLLFRPLSEVSSRLTYVHEDQRSLSQHTNFSILYPSRSYRPNPSAVDGTFAALRLDLRIGPEPVPLDFILRNGLDVAIEHSSPGFTGGDFDFTRMDGILSLSIPTFGQSYLLKPGFRIRVSAGDATGSLPPQRLFSIESSAAGFAPFGVMRGARTKEFTGSGYAAVNIEHNFRNIPLLALGIPFLYRWNVDLIVYGGAARTWATNSPLALTHTGTYYETGASISRIFDLLRADFTWRLSSPRGFAFTVGASTFL
ncbi:MAG TPA: DUF5686 family protein [Bacteroidota bacterium]|nr:DUF5686 family protein [Bacteroidota bacterium]